MKSLLLSVIFFLLFFQASLAQKETISGYVKTADGDPLPGVFIGIDNTSFATVTTNNGSFIFENITPGNYFLTTSLIGYEKDHRQIKLGQGQEIILEILLKEQVTELEEVQVVGKTDGAILKESVASISLIEAKPFYNRSINTGDLLNTISGVRVRQDGGIGNSAEISIQGLSGRQVKLFIDGVPMDFLLPVEELGLGPSLSMLPINLMERMEVYKGVVPASLGADALGGAVNIVTRQNFKDYLEVSAQHSSFNTWQTTLSAQKVTPSGFTLGVQALYASSDNNYQIDDVSIPNAVGNPESSSVRKFHDRFRSYLIKTEAGFVRQSWADKALLSFSYAELYDEIQHNFEMRQPYGQALNEARTFNTAFQYEKFGIIKNLDFSAYLGYNKIITNFTDTTLNIFNWRGEIVGQKSYGGEITTSQNLLELSGNNFNSRVNLTYSLTPQSKLILNGVFNDFKRVGNDPVAAEYYGTDLFKNPVSLTKAIGGFAYEHNLFNNKLISSSSIKAYHYRSEGFRIKDGAANIVEQDLFQWGGNQSFKFSFSDHLFTKLSYEYATRMPDRIEALGDFSASIAANPSLNPETSHNFNLGAFYNRKGFTIEVNGFSRSVENIIILQAVPPPVLSKYENLLKANIRGIEGEVQVKPKDWISFRGNATFQDLRNRSKKENSGVSSNRYMNARLPNKPYFFANLEAHFEKNNLLQKNGKLQFWWSAGYVHEFFAFGKLMDERKTSISSPHN